MDKDQGTMMSLRKFVAGNWKMNGTGENLANVQAIAEGAAV